MGFLQGLLGGGKAKGGQTVASALSFQTSAYGAPIPLCYGTNRMAGNILWYGNFQSYAQSSPSGGGGKGGALGGGGGGKGGSSSNYTYSTGVALGLCEGPIQGINNCYVDKNITSLSSLNMSLFTGTYPQSAWSYLAGSPQGLGYNGIAYIASSNYSLGNSPQLPNNNFEVQGIYSNSVQQEVVGEQDTIPGSPSQITVEFSSYFVSDGGVTDTEGNAFTRVFSSPGATYTYEVSGGVYTFYTGDAGTVVNINYTASVGPDADPSLVVNDLLTNEHYGIGFPSSRVGSLSVYQAYCIAVGLLISPVYNQQASAASMLDDIATNTNSAWIWTSGQLTLVPYGDQSITANGYTYTAPSSPLFSLTDNDFEKQQAPLNSTAAMNDDPVILTRKRPADQINSVKIECLDRNNQYNPAIIEAKDQALIENFGLRQSTTTQTHLFCNLGAGRLSAQLQLYRQGVMNMYSFTLDQRYIVLDPMDIVAITDSALGLNQQWVRIVEIQENDDYTLSFSAEEYLGNGHAPSYSFQQGRGYSADYNSAPGNVNTPVLFVPPIELAATGLEVWCAVSGQNPDIWGGCTVWLSEDNVTYAQVGIINGESRQGVLSANLPSGSDPDTVNTLAVNLTESEGLLASGTQADADNYNTLCYVDGELISYETATLTSPNTYNLTYLRRGAYGTAISSHLAGSQFARLDSGIFKFPINNSMIGSTIYIKFLSFNLWGSGQQNLTDVSPVTYVVTNPPPPAQVQNFNVQQQGAVVVFTWDDLAPFDVGLKGYDIAFGAVGSSWADKELLTEASRATEMTNAAVPPGIWEFGIRGHDITDQLGAITLQSLTVTNANDIVSQVPSEPGWPGTCSNCLVHYTGVVVPFSQNTASYYAVINPPSAPTTGSTAGGSLSSTTYYVKVTYVDATGESTASSETSQAVAASHLLTVTSPGSSGLATGYNVYVSTTTGTETLQNASPIAIGTGWTEPTSGLIAGTSPPTQNSTGFQVFDIFVPDPVSSCYYTAPTLDIGYNANLRIYASFAATLGTAQTGSSPATLTFSIDTWLNGGTDPNTYTNWAIAFDTFRYLNSRITYSGITANSVSYLTDFTPTIDTAPTTEQAALVSVSSGGTAITFPNPYPIVPYVQVTPVSGSALYATAANVTQTGFTAHVWNASGSDVGGLVNWSAVG